MSMGSSQLQKDDKHATKHFQVKTMERQPIMKRLFVSDTDARYFPLVVWRPWLLAVQEFLLHVFFFFTLF